MENKRINYKQKKSTEKMLFLALRIFVRNHLKYPVKTTNLFTI